jgi:glycosyltransferase involved in cell wall biosynthesis
MFVLVFSLRMIYNHTNKIIHLVSFNVPYPPDYGGVMDVFYKISALKQQGVGVILHCFTYGRARSKTLERECLRVYYYRRDLNLFHIFNREPFIVISRNNDELLKILKADNHPVIFEGLHTTHFLGHPSLVGRLIMVRTHNIEHVYYRNLASNERNPLRKIFYGYEAHKLEKYEPVLLKADVLLTISPGDTEYFGSKYGNSLFVGPFHPSNECGSQNGKGNYVLMHGDFSTAENNAAAMFIIRQVAPRWKYKTVIAGKRPSHEIMRASSDLPHVKVVPNPSLAQMTDLITNAQVCLLNASQPSGMKLKLINALCAGRHLVTSAAVVSGTQLESLCNIASDPDEWISITDRLMQEDFTSDMRSERNVRLAQVADNITNARKIIETINNNTV